MEWNGIYILVIIQNEKILLHSFVWFIHFVNINPKWMLKLPERIQL